jgi:uncharacterized protein YkwD
MKKVAAIFIVLLALAALGFYFRGDIETYYRDITRRFLRFEEEAVQSLKEIQKQISVPAPLRARFEIPETNLTRAGTINWTNAQREQEGLPILKENAELNAAAEAKMRDMFARQYFEHISPTGEGPSDLAEDAGYEFIAIGENLALGNFGDDEKLVEAWMNSPGHRANILSERYSEIGVAVGRGVFEGKTTWLAVQEFGRPLSDCPPEPSAGLKGKIEANNRQLEEMAAVLRKKQEELEAHRPKRGEEYNQKAEEYNALVDAYNALVVETKNLIDQFNAQATAFNECIESI